MWCPTGMFDDISTLEGLLNCCIRFSVFFTWQNWCVFSLLCCWQRRALHGHLKIIAWLPFRRQPDRRKDTENWNTMWIYNKNMQQQKKKKKERKLKTCFDVDKHSGRCAREDRWDILFKLTRRWKKLPFVRAACIYPPPTPTPTSTTPLRRKTPTSDQLTVALLSYSDHQLNLPLCLKQRSVTSASPFRWRSLIEQQLLQIY